MATSFPVAEALMDSGFILFFLSENFTREQ